MIYPLDSTTQTFEQLRPVWDRQGNVSKCQMHLLGLQSVYSDRACNSSVRACVQDLFHFYIILLTDVFVLSAYFPDYSHGCPQTQRNKNDSRNCFGITSADLSKRRYVSPNCGIVICSNYIVFFVFSCPDCFI